MAAVHILIFGEIAGCKIVLPHIATHEKKISKVRNIKVCNIKNYCRLSSSVNTWEQYQSI